MSKTSATTEMRSALKTLSLRLGLTCEIGRKVPGKLAWNVTFRALTLEGRTVLDSNWSAAAGHGTSKLRLALESAFSHVASKGGMADLMAFAIVGGVRS